MLRCALGVLLAILAACGGGDTGRDATVPDGAPACRTDTDCSDGTFCDGVERCAPGPGADARGCVAAPSPCLTGQTCDEPARACVTDCATTHDADSDGHAALVCGGDDCDDADPSRYPGNSEVCDAHDHDEDCDALTFGARDADADGHVDATCCNTDGTTTHCGDDCADSVPAIHPTATEVCNGIDDDCNGLVDEGVTQTFHADADLDGFGASAGETRMACAMPAGFVASATDCDDTNAQVHPGATRVCNGVDDECAGAVDVGCPSGVSAPMAITDRLSVIGPSAGPDELCPEGQVLIGIYTEVGTGTDVYDEIDDAYGICGTLSLVTDTSAPPYAYSVGVTRAGNLPEHGAHTAAARPPELLCPPDAVAIGIHGVGTMGSGTSVVRDVALDCATLTAHGSPGAFVLSVGATTSTGFTPGAASSPITWMVDEDCPAGHVLRGLAMTASGAWLTSMAATCGDVSLVLAAAP